jgi:hypothetical protein
VVDLDAQDVSSLRAFARELFTSTYLRIVLTLLFMFSRTVDSFVLASCVSKAV